jgi:ParB/RepB/Spo0J family partition protein
MTAAQSQTTPAAVISWMLPENIRESPSNPRKTFLEVDELAEDLKLHGMLQPVLVRPVGGEDGGHYELVFGARRLRAAKKAKLGQVPAMVRILDDREVLELQIVENSQRSDVHPLEEAEGYERLHTKHGLSVEELAHKVGKSKAAVYARMKLLALCPEARKAFYAGLLTPSTALYIARIPHADLQKAALEEATHKQFDGVLPSAREVARFIQDRYMLHLADAPFETANAVLVPKAGSCSACPKRTGSQPELFSDVKSDDVCTDPKCWEAKRVASWAGKAELLEAKGVKVVLGAPDPEVYADPLALRPPPGYAPLDHYDYERGGKLSDVIKRNKLEPKRVVMFDGKGKPVDLVRLAEVPKRSRQSHAGPVSGEAARARNEQTQRTHAAETKASERVGKMAFEAFAKAPDADFLLRTLLIDWIEQGGGNPLTDRAKVEKLKGKALLLDAAARLLKDTWGLRYVQEDEELSDDQGARPLLETCRRYKIEWRAVFLEELAKVAPKPKADKKAPKAKGKTK